jgi:hypothetical protein
LEYHEVQCAIQSREGPALGPKSVYRTVFRAWEIRV